MIAAILVRGMVGLNHGQKDTLKSLKLDRKNTCVILEDNPVNQGMIFKVKDFITYGEVNEETLKKLVQERGVESEKGIDFSGKKYLKYFRLNPPRKGFGRKGIKMPFKLGGALGNRDEKINDLIERML